MDSQKIIINMQNRNPFAAHHLIGIALDFSSPGNLHAGFFYQTGIVPESNPVSGRADPNPAFLHLFGHFSLACEKPGEMQCWLEINELDERVQTSLAIWLDTVWRRNRRQQDRDTQIPFGINYSGSPHFRQNGDFAAAESSGGLTCATFVLALLEDYGINLINTADSFYRDEDKDWHEFIIAKLEVGQTASPQYVENQKEFLGKAARYRPEAVAAAAATYSGNPISFSDSIVLGKAVLSEMQKVGAFPERPN